MAGKRALVLRNPMARLGQLPIESVLSRLEGGGLQISLATLEALPALAGDPHELTRSTDIVIVCGGDGSLSSAACMLMDSGLPLGILPMGTANDLALTLGIPRDLLAAADVIVRGETRQIDIGTVNDHAFFNVASIGLSSKLAQSLDPTLKKRFGRLGYAWAAAKVLRRASRFTARIIEKGEVVEADTYQIAIGNGRLYGGGNVIAEGAEIDDGQLDLYSLELRNLWKLALMLRSFRTGTHGAWREVRTARCVEFDIETSQPMLVNADGEIVTMTPAHFKVLPNAVTVFAPPKQHLPDAGPEARQ
jgi:YegS/Rv2252/BmrU family lipid kinase